MLSGTSAIPSITKLYFYIKDNAQDKPKTNLQHIRIFFLIELPVDTVSVFGMTSATLLEHMLQPRARCSAPQTPVKVELSLVHGRPIIITMGGQHTHTHTL